MLNKKDKYVSLGEILNARSESGRIEVNPQSRIVQLSRDGWFWNQPAIRSAAGIEEDRFNNPVIVKAIGFVLALIAVIGSIFLLGPQIKKSIISG
jgi:hypothetical protein